MRSEELQNPVHRLIAAARKRAAALKRSRRLSPTMHRLPSFNRAFISIMPDLDTAAANVVYPDWVAALQAHEGWLKRLIQGRLGEPDALEDVWQEVGLAVSKQSTPVRDLTKAAPWLYRVALRQTLLYRRKAGRRRRLIASVAEFKSGTCEQAPGSEPLGWMLKGERAALVREAVKALPSREQDVLHLKYGEGWSYEQIAHHLGVSRAAVESRLFRARNNLRRELAARSITELET